MKKIFSRRKPPWAWLWLSLLVIIADQWSKYLAVEHLVYAQPAEILPFLDFRLVYNTGAAYGLLSSFSSWHVIVLSLVSIVVTLCLLVWLSRLEHFQYLKACALALLIGGAIGNAIDRIYLNYVVDFISVHWNSHYFAIFNVADSAVTVGAILLGVSLLFCNRT